MPERATLGWITTCVAIALDACALSTYDATTNIGRYDVPRNILEAQLKGRTELRGKPS
jgi:hypothetical protein